MLADNVKMRSVRLFMDMICTIAWRIAYLSGMLHWISMFYVSDVFAMCVEVERKRRQGKRIFSIQKSGWLLMSLAYTSIFPHREISLNRPQQAIGKPNRFVFIRNCESCESNQLLIGSRLTYIPIQSAFLWIISRISREFTWITVVFQL